MKTKIPFFAALMLSASVAPAMASAADVASSPWGPDDEIGRLNMMTVDSRMAALANLNPTRAYDLSVEYFIGMPSWQAAGDPHFQMWMTHTPKGAAPLRPVAIPYREVD
ncbi:hypothetical protein [Marinobacter guineae]|uniref:hypothetical protein n=1 Tax=Marinobacter guineae TaxID=432303 RepID=UPI001B804906|nr:hypothetical protein [Marinobacter guineae]